MVRRPSLVGHVITTEGTVRSTSPSGRDPVPYYSGTLRLEEEDQGPVRALKTNHCKSRKVDGSVVTDGSPERTQEVETSTTGESTPGPVLVPFLDLVNSESVRSRLRSRRSITDTLEPLH